MFRTRNRLYVLCSIKFKHYSIRVLLLWIQIHPVTPHISTVYLEKLKYGLLTSIFLWRWTRVVGLLEIPSRCPLPAPQIIINIPVIKSRLRKTTKFQGTTCYNVIEENRKCIVFNTVFRIRISKNRIRIRLQDFPNSDPDPTYCT